MEKAGKNGGALQFRKNRWFTEETSDPCEKKTNEGESDNCKTGSRQGQAEARGTGAQGFSEELKRRHLPPVSGRHGRPLQLGDGILSISLHS